MFFINQGRTRGTTFKIDTGGYVFSCLFDTGAEVSCMNMETCTALGLLNSISDTNTQVNTVSGQDIASQVMLWSHLNLASRVLLTSFLFVDFLQDHLF